MDLALPDVRVQDSLYEVLKDVSNGTIKREEVWAEFGRREVRFAATADGLTSEAAGFRASVSDAAKALELHSPESGMVLVRFGDAVTPLKDVQRVTCGAVSGSRLLVGSDSGRLRVVHPGNPALDTDLGGHLLHTSVAGFFPSGQVALSAGMDYAIKLWDVQSGREVQVLRHQRGLVEDIAPIARGRNLLSLCPADAAAGVTLWEVGTPQVVHDYVVARPQCVAVWANAAPGAPAAPDSAPFFGVDGTAAVVGTATDIRVLDIRAPTSSPLLPTAASTLSVHNDRLVFAHGNKVVGTDLRMAQKRLFTLSSPTPVTQVLATSSKAYVRTEAQSYGFAFQSDTVEVLCCSSTGVLTSANDELWALGTEARHFPL